MVKNATGNISCGADRTLGDINDAITLINTNCSNWSLVAFADNQALTFSAARRSGAMNFGFAAIRSVWTPLAALSQAA